MKRERRFLNSEIGVVTNSESPKIVGYAAVFNSLSENLGGFRERLDPNCFSKCLEQNPDVVALLNHNDDFVLGRTTSGTLQVAIDDKGLRYEVDPPDTQVARDLMVSLKRRDIAASSFAFYALRDSWDVDASGEVIRTVLEAELLDVSPVTTPAYKETSSQVRSLFPDDKGQIPSEITGKIAEVRAAAQMQAQNAANRKQRGERRFRNIVSAVSSTPWAILPEKLETICAILEARAQGVAATKEEIQAAMGGSETAQVTTQSSGVAVIPVLGPISQRMDLFSEICGGASCEGLTKQFRAALNDDSVSAIVFDIDSPGGTVTGVPELAAEILAARGKKPIVAVANGMAASAAYWIAAAAEKFVVIPSGQVGSIGVYCTHQDLSKAMEKEGVSLTFIQAGKYKTDGNPYEPLSESAREDMQKSVDDFYAMFVKGVADGRGVSVDTVKADFGQGRMFHAFDAKALGMVDDIATLDDVVAGLLADKGTPVVQETVAGVETFVGDSAAVTHHYHVTSNGLTTAQVTEAIKKQLVQQFSHAFAEGGVVKPVADVQDGDGPDEDDLQCQCQCDACKAGNCAACTAAECDDEFCGCTDDLMGQTEPAEPSASAYLTEDQVEVLKKRVRVAQAL